MILGLAPGWECQSQSALRSGLAAQRRRRQSREFPVRRLRMRYIYGTWTTSGTNLIWSETNLKHTLRQHLHSVQNRATRAFIPAGLLKVCESHLPTAKTVQ